MKQNKIPRNEYIRKPVGKTNPYKHDVLYTNLGQWKYPGQVTRIPSNDITMQGVPYPVYGEDDLGYGQMMYPGMDYTFPGQYVTEYPQHKVFETEEDFNKDRLLQIRSKYWPTKNTRPFDTGFDVPITRSGPGPVRMPSVTSDYQGVAMMYGGDPSLPNITGHYPFGGQNTKTHTHMKEGGWLDQYQKKGEVKPWGEMTPKERAAYLDKKEALQKQNKKADAWAKKAEEKSREQAKKEYYKDWVAENYDKGAMNPMFQTVAGFTPMGVLPLAMQSGVSAINNLSQGNLIEAGIDAAFASPLLKNLKGAKKILPKIGKSNKVFKSEIDWGKWNPETPKYPELINEYNAIEQSTKKAGTWMKNADGTPYKGSPEQFVQEQSSHFKKAYPQGYDETFRGVGSTNTNPDFSKGTDLSYTPPEFTGDRGIFTADYDLAKIYAFGEKNPQMLNPFSKKGKPGVFNLIHPKGKQIEINTLFDDWQNIDLRKANKAHLQADLNNKKLHLQKMIDNPYANEKIIEKHKKHINDLQKNIDEFDSRITDAEELSKLKSNVPTIPATDDIAAYLPKSDLRKVTLRNIIDGAPGDVTIVNNKPGNYLKSRIGNVGFFDMTNPNIYKALVPAAIATGAYQQQENGGSIGGDDFRRGGLYTPPKIKRKAKKYGTSKNIQSSINKLFTRNYDVFGPGGKNIYNPKAYKTGGWLDFVD